MNKAYAYALVLSFIAVSLLVGQALTTRAAQPPPEQFHPRPLDHDLEGYAFLGSDPSQPRTEDDSSATDVVPWSKLVFQSFRDGNWEIYLANGDGTDQTRLTNVSATDIQPQLNRGSTRIVFSSNRASNYEIYAMDANGSGLNQLTFNGADDTRPVWSPSGKKIAFQSYRDGQAEVYVMNADGSGQTRLTWHSDYDGMPAWSPDGTKIVFTSRRSGGYRIWVMNADGSGNEQLSNQPISENPVWSPDGSQIAYDSDGDGDGWQELWLMNADGSDQHQMYEPTQPQTDAWARSWSPDGRYVAFTLISWVFIQGNWYWTEAYPDAYSVTHGLLRLSRVGSDWGPAWQTTDSQAPRSKVDALPTYTRNSLFVSWSGHDVGDSGLKTYDVQFRDAASENWNDWKMGTADMAASFSGTSGHTYHFRSRAVDKAYNVEAWPADTRDAQTTLYTWAATGITEDNRGTPVIGARVTTTPDAFDAIPSGDDGAFAAYVADGAGMFSGTLGKSGYGHLPATNFSPLHDARIEAVMPPGDNVVQNWGLESGDLGTNGWKVSGFLPPTITSTYKHTGQYAAFLGQSFAFAPDSIVANNWGGAYIEGPQILVDGNGAAHATWSGQTIDRPNIYYARREANSSWSVPTNVSNSPSYAANWPLIAVDSSGVVHVVWFQYLPSNSVYYARRANDGSWSSPQLISQADLGSGPAGLAVDGAGNVHVAWKNHQYAYYAWRRAGGAWSDPQQVSDNVVNRIDRMILDETGVLHLTWTEGSNGNFRIVYARRVPDSDWSSPVTAAKAERELPGSVQTAVGRNGVVHIVWLDRESGSNWGLHYTRRIGDGVWIYPRRLANAPASTHFRTEVDGNGSVHVVWYDLGGIYYTQRGPNGSWSEPIPAVSTAFALSLDLAMEGNKAVHLVWEAGPDYVYYAQRRSDGAWTDPQGFSFTGPGRPRPRLVVSGSGDVHMIWKDGAELHYAGPESATNTGDSTLSQAVTVPATMPAPTLSFLYQLGGVSSSSGSRFDAQIDNGVSKTAVFSTTSSTVDWSHGWSDLTPWAGQSVTLTLRVHQTEGGSRTWAYLDEVTLGSAYPDTWLTMDSIPDTALPGDQVMYLVNYGNRGGVMADQTELTMTLASELTFVDANPPPVTTSPFMVWDVGNLMAGSGPFTIVITSTVTDAATPFKAISSSASIASRTIELEDTNNSAEFSTLVAALTYLPLIRR